MLFFFFIAFLRGCIIADSNGVFTNGFSHRINWVYIKDLGHFNLNYCDLVIVSDSKKDSNILLNYVKRGGNLYIESREFGNYAKFTENMAYVVSTTYTPDTVYAEGRGVFNGLNVKISYTLRNIFDIDTQKVWDFIRIKGAPLIDGSIVLYATSLARGSIIVSSLPFMQDSLYSNLRRRIEGYFFPDVSIITDSITQELISIESSLWMRDSMLLRYYTGDFQGIPSGGLIIVNTPQQVVASDSTTVFYMGPFVCNMSPFCDTNSLYSMFYIMGKVFKLNSLYSISIKDSGDDKISFTTPQGLSVGFLLKRERVGFLPFSLTDIDTSDIVGFIIALKNFKYTSAEAKQKLEYFKGALEGYLKNVNKISVFTIDGRIIYKSFGNGKVFYDFKSLPYGHYVIKLTLSNGKDSLMLFDKLQGDKE